MAIQTPNTISGVTVINKNGYNKNDSVFLNRRLETGEIAIIKETTGTNEFEAIGIVMGPGKIGELIDDDKQFLHSQVGAGYKLPKATETTLGGVTLNQAYWLNVEGQYIPRWLYYEGSVNGYQTLSFRPPTADKVKVNADWIEAERVSITSAIITSTNNKYIEINSDLGQVQQAYNTCVDSGQIVYIGQLTADNFTSGIWNYRDGTQVENWTVSYNATTNRTTIFSESFIYGETYVANVNYKVDATAATALTSANDYAGIKICNWNANNSDAYAFLGTNNTGALFYSESDSTYRRVAYVPSSTGFVYSSGDSSNLTVKTPSGFKLTWDRNAEDSDSRTFAYNPAFSNSTDVNLGTIVHNIKTDDSSAIVITDHSVLGSESHEGYISVNHVSAPSITQTLNPLQNINIDESTEIVCLTGANTDDWGHLNSIRISTYNFSNLLEKVSTNISNITSLQTVVSDLATTDTVEELSNRVSNMENDISNLATKEELEELDENIANGFENVGIELEDKVNSSDYLDLKNQFIILQTNFDDLLERYEALENRVVALESTNNPTE